MPRPGLAQSPAFDPSALAALKQQVESVVAAGTTPGAVYLLARGDEVVVETVGSTDHEGGVPMRRDTIFRLASVGKVVSAVAVMMLVEDGRLALDEPVDRLLPELADRRVLKRLDAPITDTVPAERPILVRDLMNFTMGFGIQFDPNLPIQQAIDARQLVNGPPIPPTPLAPDQWMARFGELPLMAQPGATWMYNTGTLVLGVLIARASGKPLPEFLDERIFRPLGMVDTGFVVPAGKLDRFQPTQAVDFATNKQFSDDPADGVWTRPPAFPSTAAGLVSTVDDWLAFARMLLDGGSHHGRRLLAEASVAEITRDQLAPEQKAGAGLGPGFFDKAGWGYGVRVATAADDISATPGRYGWNGGYGTSWSNDPNTGLIGILFSQSVLYYVSSNDFREFWRGAYAAAGT